MPKENAKPTKSGHNPKQLPAKIYIIVSIILALIIYALFFMNSSSKPSPYIASSNGCAGLQLGSDCFMLEKADTDVLRVQGLSGRTSLPSSLGMLFIFDRASEQCFWMKDMLLPLDMIWLDSSKRIVKIEHNVDPSTYPDSF